MLFSPITPFIFKGTFFHVKRDDLLTPFEGNKARKLYCFLNREFKDIRRIVSYGSNQSNAMYAMSMLAKIKGVEFIYYTNHIPTHLKQNPYGNYFYALKNGTKIIETDLRGDKFREFILSQKDDKTLIIEEGARIKESEEGIRMLAKEINDYCKINSLKVFLPSGTGTTAFYLAKHLDVEVITTPCVADEEYLKKQWSMLGKSEKLPVIIPPKKKYKFGKLYKNLYDLWKELKNAGIEFDMLYDPIGWEVVLENNLTNILYIHQGGIPGNASMLKRYKRKYESV